MLCSNCSPTFTALKKLKEGKLLSRLRSNQTPSALERVELTELVSQAEKEVIKYEETIARLHEMIITYENAKNNLIRQVSLARSLMAPVRRLPPEILRQVFIEHGTANEIRSLHEHVPGFQLTSICCHWRAVATANTTLWKDITFTIEEESYPNHVFLVQTILEFSANARLNVTINCGSSHEDTLAPPALSLLCDQAHRWETFSGFCRINRGPVLDVLSSIQGRLTSLHTFQFVVPFRRYNVWIQNAPKLHTLTVEKIDVDNALIPLNQLVHFEMRFSLLSEIARSLLKLPNLLTLTVKYPRTSRVKTTAGDRVVERLVNSNITALEIVVRDESTEENMASLFDMLVLPKLQSLSIVSTCDYKTNQEDTYWSAHQLPALISRSSALITSFKLDDIWMPPGDLIALLRSMPALTDLFICELSIEDDPSVLTDEFFLNLHCHRDRQPLLTNLTSLTLFGFDLSFTMRIFVEAIQSRWIPSSLAEDEVACIRTVELHISEDTIDPDSVRSLMALRKRGLDITIEDENGDVFVQDLVSVSIFRPVIKTDELSPYEYVQVAVAA